MILKKSLTELEKKKLKKEDSQKGNKIFRACFGYLGKGTANQHFLKFGLGDSVKLRFTHIQCRPFTMLCLGSIGMDHNLGHCGELSYQLFAR